MVLKDADWEHDHKFELVVSGHNTWWKCSCARIASHPEVMTALVDAVERIRELEEIGSFIENARDVLVDASKYFDRYGGVDVDDYGKVRRKIGGMIGVLRDVVITYNTISDKGE